MKYDPSIHHRRSTRLVGYDYSIAGAYFVTVVTQNRKNLFGEIKEGVMQINHMGEIISSTWLNLPTFFQIHLGERVIMPNHLHGIIWIFDHGTGEASARKSNHDLNPSPADASPLRQPIGTQSGSLGAIVQDFKSVSTRRIHQYYQVLGTTLPQQIWQRNYFEHIIRNEHELDQIGEYIVDNPRRWMEDKEYRG